MKAIMLSIQPKWTAKILNGEKTIEARTTCPKEFKYIIPGENVEPIDVLLYVTKGDKNNCLEYADNPKQDKKGMWVCGKGYPYANGKVVAKFTLNKVFFADTNYEDLAYLLRYCQTYKNWLDWGSFFELLEKDGCLNFEQANEYLKESNRAYAWLIDDLVIFDKPKELSEFYKIRCKNVNEDDDCLYCNNNHQCPFAEIDYNPDDSINAYICGKPKKPLTRAPQSWQYIEVDE